MTKYKSHIFFLLLAFFYSANGAAIPEENTNNIKSVDDQNIQIKNSLNLNITNNSIQQENRNDKNIQENNKDISKQNQDIQFVTQEEQADHQRMDDIELGTETTDIQKGNRETPKDNKGLQNDSQGVQKEIKLIHEEFREIPLEEIEFPYTKPMQPDTTEKQSNDFTIKNINNGDENVKMTTENQKTMGEDQALQQLNEDKIHLLKDNINKENQIKKLEAEKNLLVKKIIDSIDEVVNNTKNISEKKDLKELKTIIKILGNVENSKENTYKENAQATVMPTGLLAKVIAARKAGERREPANLFSPEDMNSFAEAIQRGKHIGREYVEYTTRNIDKENERKEKHRGKVKKNLDAWLQDRELFHPCTPDGPTKRKFIEKCENWGWTRDKYKNIIVRPCCKFCCQKSYLGCK